MQPKKKKCRGTGKAKGYGCGKEVYNRRFGLCQSCFTKWLLNDEQGKAYLEKQIAYKKKNFEKEKRRKEREKKKQWLEENKSITQLINEAKIPFQKWIRKRDANRSCISCGTTTSEIWDAGHFYKAEIYTGLIFDEMNVHKQCRKCNTFLGGNENNYRLGLIKRYGEDYVKQLDKIANEKRLYRYTKDELRAIKKDYQNKLKDENN